MLSVLDDLQFLQIATTINLVFKKNNHNYKAVLCDVDGTLVCNKYNGKISKKVRDTILKAKNGVKIGIATGRALDRVTFIFDELGLKNPCIINGGAQIVHPVSRKILWEKPILPKDLKNITSILSKLQSKVWMVDNNKEKLFTNKILMKKPISFFISKIKEHKADMIIKKLSESGTLSLNKVVAYKTGCISLHITHAGATKKFAALKLAELMQIKQNDIIGVGDGYNDFPLFNACGLKVAIGNAVPGLKKASDYVAPTVNEDGVAAVIEKFVLN